MVDQENHDADRRKTEFQNHIKVFVRLGIFIVINGDVIPFVGPTCNEGSIPCVWLYVKFRAAFGYPWIERSFPKSGVVSIGNFERGRVAGLMAARNAAMFDNRGFPALNGYVRVDATHGVAEVILCVRILCPCALYGFVYVPFSRLSGFLSAPPLFGDTCPEPPHLRSMTTV